MQTLLSKPIEYVAIPKEIAEAIIAHLQAGAVMTRSVYDTDPSNGKRIYHQFLTLSENLQARLDVNQSAMLN